MASRRALQQVAARRDEAWQQAAEETRRRVRRFLGLPFLPGVVIGLLGIVFLPLAALGGALLVAWAALSLYAWRAANGRVADRLGGMPAEEAVAAGLLTPLAAARYRDVAESLCAALGVALPELFVLVDPAPNSISCRIGAGRARLFLTTGLASSLERIELEAVLAHELSHVKRLDTLSGGLSAALLKGGGAPLPAARRLASWLEGPYRELEADLAAVQVTRYPPGLIRALELATGEDPTAPVPSVAVRPGVLAETVGQWLVPLAGGAGEPERELGGFGPSDRVAVLIEL